MRGEMPTAAPFSFKEQRAGKKEKKSWYQYVFLGLAWENGATEEVRRIGASSPIPSNQSTHTLSVKLVRKADSFTSEGALVRQGDCFRLARHSLGKHRMARSITSVELLEVLRRSLPRYGLSYRLRYACGPKARIDET